MSAPAMDLPRAIVNEKIPKDISKTSIDAISIENGHDQTRPSDKALDRRLLLKRDLILLPTVGLLYMIVSFQIISAPGHALTRL